MGQSMRGLAKQTHNNTVSKTKRKKKETSLELTYNASTRPHEENPI